MNKVKFFFDIGGTRKLFTTLKFNIPKNVKKIYAAIAYTHSRLLVDICIEKEIHLEWWGLFDSQESTSIELIQKAINTPLVKFYPFAERFHPKVIYFEGYGIYVGSANMTTKALLHNIEAGIFIEESDLTEENLKEITEFFDTLRKKSIPATSNDLEKIEKFLEESSKYREDREKINENIEQSFQEHLGHLFLLEKGVRDFSTKANRKTKDKELSFKKEWRETQNYLSHVEEVLQQHKQPEWVHEQNFPKIITVQFIYAYYHSNVLEENEGRNSDEVVEEYFQKNKKKSEGILLEAIKWWSRLKNPPSSANDHINKWTPSNYRILSKLRKTDLSLKDFSQVIAQNHAAREHARQVRNETLGLEPDYHGSYEERTKKFTEWLFHQKTQKEKSIHDVIKYILFFESEDIEVRIFNVLNSDDWKIAHFGKKYNRRISWLG